MFFSQTKMTWEEKQAQQDEKLEKIESDLAKLKDEFDKFLSSHHLEAHHIEQYNNDPDNFTPEEWDVMQELIAHQKKRLDDIENKVVDPRVLKKKYAERRIDNNWLYVK